MLEWSIMAYYTEGINVIKPYRGAFLLTHQRSAQVQIAFCEYTFWFLPNSGTVFFFSESASSINITASLQTQDKQNANGVTWTLKHVEL